jgi:hypothetical protein
MPPNLPPASRFRCERGKTRYHQNEVHRPERPEEEKALNQPGKQPTSPSAAVQAPVRGATHRDGQELQLQRTGNRAAIRLLDTWLADESGYDEQAWPELKKFIEKHRLGRRKRFSA